MKNVGIMLLCIFTACMLLYQCSYQQEGIYALALSKQVDRIIVYKQKREMHVFAKDTLLKIYRIALGANPIGHKQFQGDMKTPEGTYTINGKNPNSAYHLNLGISYPNQADRENAKKHGKSPGGDIKIHGLPNGMGHIGKTHILSDWTHGCIAVSNEEIEELYKHVPLGTSITIYP